MEVGRTLSPIPRCALANRQAQLGTGLANALHCKPISSVEPAGNTKCLALYLFGKRRHVERVKLLWTLLNPQMLAQAKEVKGQLGVSTTVARRSFMDGFAVRIHQRLAEAEKQAADDEVAESYALALVDDKQQAEDAYQRWLEDQRYCTVNRKRKRTTHRESYNSGVNAANRADLNQTRVGGARAAIGS